MAPIGLTTHDEQNKVEWPEIRNFGQIAHETGPPQQRNGSADARLAITLSKETNRDAYPCLSGQSGGNYSDGTTATTTAMRQLAFGTAIAFWKWRIAEQADASTAAAELKPGSQSPPYVR